MTTPVESEVRKAAYAIMSAEHPNALRVLRFLMTTKKQSAAQVEKELSKGKYKSLALDLLILTAYHFEDHPELLES